ncbi:unnamed protein product [Bemisia tabaci]|uniref:AAA-ATPase-like domain-containing protein n=1 Tax=Bemisia tabaci TaxID=7038 RepID=A0A9P0AL39_BEMTA|nr:unnamed protein product [Bemisia tabaci]
MMHFAIILFVFVIGRPFDGTRADWADEQQKHQAKTQSSSATNSDTGGHMHQFKDPVPLSSDFTGIRRSRAFVDKTFFLHEWLTHRPKFWYVTAPPGFGKSTLATMAVQFLNVSFEIENGTAKFHEKHKTPAYELFQGTNIFEMQEFFNEHFQNYVVVYIDLAPLSSTTRAVFSQTDDFNTQDFHKNFKMVIRKMMSYYPSLLHHGSLSEVEKKSFKGYLEEGVDPADPTPNKFWKSAFFLMRVLNKCLRKDPIVIVDSYDAVCKPAMIRSISFLQRPYVASYIINFSKMLIKDGLATVLYLGSFNTVELMLMKAHEQHIKSRSIHQIQHTDFFREERIAKYFGLSAQEVLEVLRKHSMQDDFQLLEDTLNGHAVLESALTLFNTRSVLSYVANRNATPRALISPITADILHDLGKMFANQQVSDIVTESIFASKTKVLLGPQDKLQFSRFTKIKKMVEESPGVQVKEDFKKENSLAFIKILQFLGLLSAVSETLKPDQHSWNFRASSRCDAELMLDHLYRVGSAQQFFMISAEHELAMIRAVKGLAPTNDSIQTLGETIHNIVKARVPEADFQLKSLMYVYARKVATHYSEDFTLEAMIAAPKTEHSKSNKDLRNDTKERIDIILVLKSKKIGVIMTSKFNTSATTLLEEMTNRKYVDVFESDSRFSKLGIANKILIGISVQSDGSVQIAAEAWHQDEKTNLKNVVINNTSLQ